MKIVLFCLTFLTAGLVLASADDPAALQVAPSDQVKYPDASQVLNKTEVKAATVPLAKPLLAATPIPVKTWTAKPADNPPQAKTPASPSGRSAGQWFLKWSLTGDEAGVLGWAQALNRGASVHKLKDGLWEVWAGPFEAKQLKDALDGQAGIATLVKR